MTTVEQLKPGMSAVVEIRVDRLRTSLDIPVQAVVQIENDTWCYVDLEGQTERRMIELGRTNDKFVEIRSGLSAGERIVLNPMAILDESDQRDAEGAAEEQESAAEDEDRVETPPAVEPAVEPQVEPFYARPRTATKTPSPSDDSRGERQSPDNPGRSDGIRRGPGPPEDSQRRTGGGPPQRAAAKDAPL